MKLLATITVTPGTTLDTIRAQLEHELRGSWKLFADGHLREVYATESATKVVFVLEANDQAAARALLQTLPLIASGAMTAELTELRPFVNWSRLFAT